MAAILAAMAEPAPEITPNDGPLTDSELRGRLDHIDETLHRLLAIATPEAMAALDKFLNNPAMRFARRHRT